VTKLSTAITTIAGTSSRSGAELGAPGPCERDRPNPWHVAALTPCGGGGRLRLTDYTDLMSLSTDDNKALVATRFEELDRGNLGVLDEMFAADYVLHLPGEDPLDLTRTKQFYSELYSAIPDLTHTIEDQIAEDDKVVTRWTARGTHRGELLGREATGSQIAFSGINIYRIADGKLAESYVNWDLIGIAQQLRLVETRRLV
jgi:predicted ester cyclase